MIYRGTVKGNVVMLEPGAELPDGTPVHIQTEESGGNGSLAGEFDPFRMGEGAVQTGIPDWPPMRIITFTDIRKRAMPGNAVFLDSPTDGWP